MREKGIPAGTPKSLEIIVFFKAFFSSALTTFILHFSFENGDILDVEVLKRRSHDRRFLVFGQICYIMLHFLYNLLK